MYTIEKFFHSTVWMSFGSVLDRIKYILISILVFRLGNANLALFYISIHLVIEFSLFSNRLVSSIYNRFLRDGTLSKEKLHAVMNSSIQLACILGIFSGIIIYFLAQPIAFLIRSDAFVLSIQILAFTVPFITVTNQIMQILLLRTSYREAVTIHYIIQSSLTLIAAYIAIFILKADIYTVLLWQVGAAATSMLLAFHLLHRVNPTFRLSKKFVEVPPITSLTNVGHVTSITLLSIVDMLIIGFYFGIVRLGTYVAMIFGPQLIYAIPAVTFSMFIHTAASFSSDRGKVIRFSQKVMQLLLILTIPLAIVLLLYPKEVLHTAFGIHAQVDPLTVRLLSLAFFVRTVSWTASQILIVTRKTFINMRINIILLLCMVPLLIFTAPRYGFAGVALVTFGIAVLELFIKIIAVYKKTKIYFFSYTSIKILLIGISFYMFHRFVLFTDFKIFLLYFPCVFFLSLLVLGCIQKNDLVFLRRELRNAVSFVSNI